MVKPSFDAFDMTLHLEHAVGRAVERGANLSALHGQLTSRALARAAGVLGADQLQALTDAQRGGNLGQTALRLADAARTARRRECLYALHHAHMDIRYAVRACAYIGKLAHIAPTVVNSHLEGVLKDGDVC